MLILGGGDGTVATHNSQPAIWNKCWHSKKIKEQPAAEDDIFDEIINHYIDENMHKGDAAENLDVKRNSATTADTDVTFCKLELTLQLR